jgi:hypothetical protein
MDTGRAPDIDRDRQLAVRCQMAVLVAEAKLVMKMGGVVWRVSATSHWVTLRVTVAIAGS